VYFPQTDRYHIIPGRSKRPARAAGTPDPFFMLHAPCCHVITSSLCFSVLQRSYGSECFVSDTRAPSLPGTLVFRGTEQTNGIEWKWKWKRENGMGAHEPTFTL